ncbi:MAG: polyprenol monophosphomannose synthase [Saprospiraceae bacterium]|nr:polyprenol monophosphomannose synthase [Saprospiraceae bacterium]MBK8483394.1 polyprenol monophosphomannose synthase [Saprospiraceae bacterium]MBK9729271.1 polyprenol monophosphomannose synthase [Saprospiraceae bacterium]
MGRLLVIIPTYNEIENIDAIISKVLSLTIDVHILIVDDGSPDGTGNAVKTKQLEFPEKIHLLERAKKSGLGTAYIAGFKWALEHDYTCVAEMDADFSHPPEKLIEMYQTCSNKIADVAIGSRYIKGGGVVNWPMIRLLLSRGASIYVQLITGMGIKDPTAGFVCYNRKVLENLNLDHIIFTGYAFQIEMKYAVYLLGYKMKEIPILFPDRVKGKSKMNIYIVKEALTGVLKMRFGRSKKDYIH